MFLAPWFLAGLLAIGLPLWLHRIARNERVKVPFASTMLLEASEVRDTSRRSLRYWLLLAARILLLILLALAFAQPLWTSRTDVTGEAKLQAVVIDTSLSMQYDARWQHALDEANTFISNIDKGDRILLIAASGKKIDIAAGPVPVSDRGTVLAALRSLQPTMERLDYGMLMSSASAWLSDSPSANAKSEWSSAQIHVFTDLQQSASPLRFADLAPPAKATVQLHDVSKTAAENISIASVTAQGADARIFTATLRGAPSKTARQLSLTIDDRAVETKSAMLDEAGNAHVSFTGVKLKPGSHRVRFDLQPHDALPADDAFYAVIEHTEPAVLLITHDPTADEAAYLASAIESQTATRLTVERATSQTLAKVLANKPLSDYSAVFVADTGVLTQSQAKQIAQYAEAGGSVFLTLGPRAAQTKQELVTSVALPKTISAEQRVSNVDDSHPVLRDTEGWPAVRVMKSVAVNATADDKVLIKLEDGSPLLIERLSGAGHILLLTSPLDRTWNDLPIHSLFVRFIADAAGYLTARDASAMSYSVGTRIATGVVKGASGQIFDPKGERVLALAEANEASHLTPTQTGFYEVRSGLQKHWLAVNVDPRESDLSPMAPETVQRWQSLAAVASQSGPVPGNQTVANTTKDERRAWGWQFLLAAGVFALIELLLANYRLTIRRDGARYTSSGAVATETQPS